MPELDRFPIHLGLGASAVPQPLFTGEMDWYGEYGERHGDDGVDGRLVSQHTFTADWDVWEVHPVGAEVVLVTAGQMRLYQEIDGNVTTTELGAGSFAINQPGVWHTADVMGSEATAVFITAGIDTEHRPR